MSNEWSDEPWPLHLNGFSPTPAQAPAAAAIPRVRTIHVLGTSGAFRPAVGLVAWRDGQAHVLRRPLPARRRLVRRWQRQAPGWALVLVPLIAGAVLGIGLAFLIAAGQGWLRLGV